MRTTPTCERVCVFWSSKKGYANVVCVNLPAFAPMKYKLRSISPLKGMVQLQGEKVGLIGERRREVTKMHSLQKISLQKIFLLQVRQRPTAPASLPVANDCPCLYLRLRIIERTSCALLSGYCVISASPPGGIPSGWVRLLLVSLWLLKPGNMDGMAGRAMAVFLLQETFQKIFVCP